MCQFPNIQLMGPLTLGWGFNTDDDDRIAKVMSWDYGKPYISNWDLNPRTISNPARKAVLYDRDHQVSTNHVTLAIDV